MNVLDSLIREAGYLGVESQAGDAGVGEVVGGGNVDLAHSPLHRHFARALRIARNSVHAREVVARAERNQRQRSAAQVETAQRSIEGPISAANHHTIEAATRTLGRFARQIFRTEARVCLNIGTQIAEMPLHIADMALGAATSRGRVVNDSQTHGCAKCIVTP